MDPRLARSAAPGGSPSGTYRSGEGSLSQAARAVAAESRRRRTLSATDEAVLAALIAVGDALDRQPGSAALLHEWRGLLVDLRVEAPGQPQRDLAALLEDFRADVGTRRMPA
jgi:hypothetical protein